MMKQMQLYLTRHTQTNYNVARLLNADPSGDVHLTEEGIRQAKRLAHKLADESFDRIYISTLPRTRQTAEIINEFHGVPLLADNRLNDNLSGFESRPVQEYLEALNRHADPWSAVLGDGESLAQARARAGSFLEELKSQPHQSVLVVTHGFTIESIYGLLHDLSLEAAAAYQIPQGDFRVFDI